MAEAHAEGMHENAPRDGCPECLGRDLSTYPPAAVTNSYAVTLEIGRVKEEHIAYTVALMNALSSAFGLDGTDVSVDLSVERNRDGIERVYEYIQTEDRPTAS